MFYSSLIFHHVITKIVKLVKITISVFKMNIHEHQAKEILKEFGAPVSNGVVIMSIDEINKEIKKLNSKEYVLKAQIHAGGRGKAGGVKLVKNLSELETEASKMIGKVLVTHQTGPEGKEVKRLYIEEASDATFSISIPPSVLHIKAIFDDSLSIKHDR